jgi:hypothetical protein
MIEFNFSSDEFSPSKIFSNEYAECKTEKVIFDPTEDTFEDEL